MSILSTVGIHTFLDRNLKREFVDIVVGGGDVVYILNRKLKKICDCYYVISMIVRRCQWNIIDYVNVSMN